MRCIIMQIYTSYFAVEKKIPADITRVSIAKWMPKGLRFIEYQKLAPTEKILKAYKEGILTQEKYEKAYKKEVLSKVTVNEVMHFLKLVGNGNDIVLLCFEKSSDFCHRHILAEWFIEQGIQVDEYPIS